MLVPLSPLRPGSWVAAYSGDFVLSQSEVPDNRDEKAEPTPHPPPRQVVGGGVGSLPLRRLVSKEL